MIDDIFGISELIDLLIPEGTNKEVEVNGTKVSISKKDGNIKIKTVSEDKFDDSSIKERIADFKNKIEELDDEIFNDINEDFGEKVNINGFNKMIESENIDEDQAKVIEDLITKYEQTARCHLQDKIQSLVNLFDRF